MTPIWQAAVINFGSGSTCSVTYLPREKLHVSVLILTVPDVYVDPFHTSKCFSLYFGWTLTVNTDTQF